MKNKKMYLYGLIALFVLVVIALIFLAFSVKELKITYSCIENADDTLQIEEELQALNGKNLLFISQNDIDKVLENYPFFEVTGFEKSYPDNLIINITERRQVYTIQNGDEFVVLSDSGIVLSIGQEKKANLIEIKKNDSSELFNKIEIVDLSIGSKIKTNIDDVFYKTLKKINDIKDETVVSIEIQINQSLNICDVKITTTAYERSEKINEG